MVCEQKVFFGNEELVLGIFVKIVLSASFDYVKLTPTEMLLAEFSIFSSISSVQGRGDVATDTQRVWIKASSVEFRCTFEKNVFEEG